MTRGIIIDTADPRKKAVKISINSNPEKIFSFLSDPRRHRLFDGSNSIQANISGPTKLYLGARFGMRMRIKIPYKVTNQVIEYEENRKIAWRHLMKHVWSYELKKISENQTEVIEMFDGNPAVSQWWLNRTGAYKWVEKVMGKSLVRLKELSEK
jgi:hypothetical protein